MTGHRLQFFVKQAVFYGHAVEDNICDWGTVAFGTGTVPKGKVVSSMLSGFWGQPQDRLQMEATFCRRWTQGFGRSFARAAPAAASSRAEMDRADQASAPRAASVGCQEIARTFCPGGFAPAQRTNDCPLAQTVAPGEAATEASPQSVCAQASIAHGGAPGQSGLDGGFQRMVSRGQWRALRTLDGPGFVQPIWVVGAGTSDSAVAARASSLYEAFSRKGNAGSDSRGQRRPLCVERSSRAFPLEQLVDPIGDSGRVYPARSSRRQCSARTVSSRAQTRDHTPGGLDAWWPATSHERVAQRLQRTSSSRVFGTENAAAVLPESAEGISAATARTAIFQSQPEAKSPEQRGGPMGWTQTFYRRSLCETNDRIAPAASRNLGRLFCAPADRPLARPGSGSDAPSRLQASFPHPQKIQTVTYVLSLKCYLCIVTVPTPVLSLADRESTRAALASSSDLRFADGLATIPPLPMGEGRGEGE